MRKIIFMMLVISISLITVSCAAAKEKMSPKAKVSLRNANMYLQQMKLDKAMTFYEEVLKDSPDNLEAIKKTGDIYFAWGEEKGSQPIDTLKSEDDQKLQKSKHDSESVDAYSMAFQKYQRYQELIKDRTDLTKEEEGWKTETAKKILGCEARIFNIGKGEVSAGEYETAIPIFDKLRALDPQKPEALKMLLFIYLDEQNSAADTDKVSYNSKIEELLNKLLEINPKDPDTLSKLGAFYYSNQQPDKALEIFKQIEIQKPKDVDNLFSMVGIYNDKKMSKEAYETDLKILALEPNNVDAVDNARIFAIELKKTDEAKKYFAKLIELSKTTDNLSQYCIFLSSNAMYTDLLPVAQEWYEMDNQSKDAVNFIVFAATKLGKKDLVNYYTAIAKKMQ